MRSVTRRFAPARWDSSTGRSLTSSSRRWRARSENRPRRRRSPHRSRRSASSGSRGGSRAATGERLAANDIAQRFTGRPAKRRNRAMTISIPGGYSPAPDAFAGRAVLVTGAGGGLGCEVALGAARCGAEVILLGRTVRKLEAVHDRIVEAGGPPPAIYPMDLSGAGPDDYAALADRIAQAYGRLHGIVHAAAAAFSGLAPLAHLEPADWLCTVHREPDRALSRHDRLPAPAPVRAGRGGGLRRRRPRPARACVLGRIRGVEVRDRRARSGPRRGGRGCRHAARRLRPPRPDAHRAAPAGLPRGAAGRRPRARRGRRGIPLRPGTPPPRSPTARVPASRYLDRWREPAGRRCRIRR